jgi:hypothetical protein
VFHALPKSWETAQSDGERWRWLLVQAMEAQPARTAEVLFDFASFQRQQFDVQTMAWYGRFFGGGGGEDEEKKDESGPYAVKTLGEDETIAKLACGVRRFKLPDEFNFIKVYQRIANEFKGSARARDSLSMLGQIFEDRQQYDQAAGYWRQYGDANRVNQILGNWGLFEPAAMQPGGKGATVAFRFRNGKKVSFTAQEVDVVKLLADLKTYIKSEPPQVNWEQVNLGEIGHGLVERGRQKYVGAQVAAWDLDLKPRDAHFDRRITVATPLQKAGAYLLTAKMEGGNTSRIVLWVNDTVIVKKPLTGQAFYYVADAGTGQPVAAADVQLFGYRQEWKGDGRNYRMIVRETTGLTDADGQMLQKSDENQNYQWLATATTKDGRLAFLGWTYVWAAQYHDAEYNAQKVFAITDRPVYRPGQTVKYKFWASQAQYDKMGPSPFAGHRFEAQIHNPKGEHSFTKPHTADEFGGLDGEYQLPKDATLGVYQLALAEPSDHHWGGGTFRVEEYKKPEFEVKVEAPAEPVRLGEKVTATIQAKYYFGAPVTEAKLKYKVLRFNQTATWYPHGVWDWFYGRGYWWFAYDYLWYPGFREWGCCRPSPWWWGVRQEPPEVVAEADGKIGADGTLKVEIDTALAKAMHGDTDHRYEITAEVTDQSRRTIVGTGQVLVARKPFQVFGWVDHGYYKVGDAIRADFQAQTLDQKPVKGTGVLKLLKVSYDKDMKPAEAEAQKWNLDTNEEGLASQQLKASAAGQYRLSYRLKDAKGHEIEGGYIFTVTGEGFDGGEFRFNDLELVTDKREYKPDEQVQLMVNTNRAGAAVLLFVRPANGVYLPPKILRLKGKSALEAVAVAKKDMPNFFVEAVTVGNGKVSSEMREIVVPPEQRILKVELTPSAAEYKPGAPAKVKLKLAELNGEPYSGSAVVSIYDKAVEYISGGSNVPEIKEFFWKWRRRHHPQLETSFLRVSQNILRQHETGMTDLGVFGRLAADQDESELGEGGGGPGGIGGGKGGGFGGRGARKEKSAGLAFNGAPAAPSAAAPMDAAPAMEAKAERADKAAESGEAQPAGAPAGPMATPTLRTQFADTAFWAGNLRTALDGTAEIELKMPENLTTWKIKVWAMGSGTRVGQAEAEVLTTKNLIVRLQAPRFFVQKDEVVLSANVHNYLKTKKSAQVVLECAGGCLAPMEGPPPAAGQPFAQQSTVEIEPKGEKRVDWRVKVLAEGEAVVRMKALTDEESDAMEMRFPVYVHGMSKMDSFAGTIRPEKETAVVTFNVPQERRPEASRLEVRYSPTLAGAMVDALPYLCEYPYGCTEQTLNRFLPTVITQKVLLRTGVKLAEVRDKLTNLNAQEIGADTERARQWKRYASNPVFDERTVAEMVVSGVTRLTNMQLGDGGWGWFSGWGEHSYPHTTAYVVHGLQIARENDVPVQGGVIERGVEWLRRHQAQQIVMLRNAPAKTHPWKESADNLDAFVYMVLGDAKLQDPNMREFLYRDRNNLAVYGKAMFGIALHKQNHAEQRDMLVKNVEQFLVQDAENESAYLKLPGDNAWWYWYGSEYEAQAYYLKLLAAVDPKGEKAPRLVKYLLNNRKHATYWNSTRDTALCVEAFADYLKASGEDKPELTLEVVLDGKKRKEVDINASNLFTFDNAFVLSGHDVTAGEHKLEFRKKGKGSIYFNSYVTNFTLEDYIPKAGLEIKVERKFYKLKRVDKTEKVEGALGQAVDQKVEKYAREGLKDLAELKSGDLVEVELEIESKNDYEYIIFEDMKAAGFEPVEVRSGYNGNAMGAYVEFRDERVCFFVPWLARGKHSVAYRLRAEIPGKFSALPARASAMYAPELRANSDEIKLRIAD